MAQQPEPTARKLELRILEVVRVQELTPRMRRIVLGGEGLSGFEVPGNALGPYVKLLIPPGGTAEPAWPFLDERGRLSWPEVGQRPAMRTYSVRRLDAGAGELQIDFVLHGDAGIGSAWAACAVPGMKVGIWGPGCTTVQNIDWYLLAGDHTALPAISFILENLPRAARGQAFIAVPEAADEMTLAAPGDLAVTWIHAGSGRASGELLEAVRSMPWRDGRALVWAGAEANLARAIRAHARRERGLPVDQCHILNYWKDGKAEGSFDYTR